MTSRDRSGRLTKISVFVLTALNSCTSIETRPLLDSLPELTLVEEKQYARTEDERSDLTSVAAIASADDGTIYVLDSREQLVRVFDSSGVQTMTFGRKGEGPGEFTWPESLGVLGDSIWVADPSRRLVTFFTRDGRFINSIPAPVVPIAGENTRTSVRAAFPRRNGTLVSTPSKASFNSEIVVDSLRVPRLLFDTNGRVIDTLSWQMQHQLRAVVLSMAGGMVGVRPAQFPSHPIDVEQDTVRVIVSQHRTTGGEGRLRVSWVNDRDVLQSSRDHNFTPRRVDRARIEAVVSSHAESFAKNGMVPPGVTERVRAALEFPDYLPIVSRVMVGVDGTVWLLRGDTADDVTPRWIVLDAHGTIRGEIALPSNAQLVAFLIKGDRVWVPLEDESGLLWIGRFRIVGGAPTG